MKECKEFIIEHKESKYKLVMEHQKRKYLKLWQQKYRNSNSGKIDTGGCSNQDQVSTSKTKHSVVNLSSKSLSTAQETVLAHGPNFTVTPETPHTQNI